MLNLFRFVGYRHLSKKLFRTLLTVLGVGLGIALFTAIRIINQSTLASFRENFESIAGKAKLVVVSSGESGFPESELETIKTIPGVKYAIPMIESRAYLLGEYNAQETLMILGIDLLQEQSVRTYKTADEEVIDDPLVFLNQPDSIIVTHTFAAAHHLQIESPLILATSTGKKTFKVRGMLSPEGPAKAYGGGIGIMDIDGARATFGKEGKIDRVDIVPDSNASLEDLQKRMQAKLGDHFHVEKPQTQSEDMERMVQSYQTLMTFFSSLALVVGLFLVMNSMSMSVSERKREIGTLRALGATRTGILVLFLLEAAALGALGSVIGVGLGRVLASGLVKLVSQALSNQSLTKIEVSSLTFTSDQILYGIGIGAIASVLAAFWPAWRATRVDPLEAMRHRDIVKIEQVQRSFFIWSAVAGVLLLGFSSLSAYLQWNRTYPLLEQINQFLSVIGAALVSPGIVMGWVRLFRPITLPLGGTVTRLAQDNLIRNPKRTSSNVISLMIGLVLVILISITSKSFKESLLDWFDRALKMDFIVSSSGQIISYQTQPLDEKIGQDLVRIPGVRKNESTNGVLGLRFVHIRYQGEQIAIKAYDEPDPRYEYSTIVTLDRPTREAGYDLYHSPVPGVLISENFGMHFQKKTGQEIEIETPTGMRKFKILGTVVDFASNTGVLYMDRKIYKRFWKDTLVNAFGVDIESGLSIEDARKRIQAGIGASLGLMVVSNEELRQQMIEVLNRSFAGIHAIEMAALLIGLMGLLNTLLVSVMERLREIGMLRAIGMSRRQLSGMILQEALFQGGFGALTAVILGSWLGYVWISTSLSHVLGWVIQFYFPWTSIVMISLLGMGVAIIAGIFPAKKAADLQITEALEYE